MKTKTKAAILAVVTFLLLGCSPRTVPYPVETVRIERVEADTAKFMALINSLKDEIESRERTTDSIVREHKKEVTVNEHGDTTKEKELIYIYISHQQEQDFRRIIESQHDSINSLNTRLASVKTDSIPVPYPVERKLTKWEQTKLELGGWATGGLIVAVIAVVWLVFKKRRR